MHCQLLQYTFFHGFRCTHSRSSRALFGTSRISLIADPKMRLARAARAPWGMVVSNRGRQSPGTRSSLDSRAGRQSLLISLPFLSFVAAASSPDPGSLFPLAGWIDGQRWREGAAFVQPVLRNAAHPAVGATCPRLMLRTPALLLRHARPLPPPSGLSAGIVPHGLCGGGRTRGFHRTGTILAAGERGRIDGKQSDPWPSHHFNRVLERQGAGQAWPPPW